ncbi:MAG: glycosyltransferase family 1 protein, partial [Ardenticatenaceae bacterium]
ASLPEVVGDAALIVDPYDTNAMAETMYQILSNPSLQEELRHKGIERAQTFTWQRAARETVAVYQKALRTTM